ncbi:peptidoglycan DD-metalloendopeptidase family protein [Elongatibacter sediminis]|uniref:Peptidoglycan DD-metalloendopeptidase family protein n=1 Tax=Elongatibacter sediminis TaxID=3119006 RepID=A0AAW9RNS2_9GAMM
MFQASLASMRWSLLACLAVNGIATASNIYKYQDENGIWHFTDRAPTENTEFETVFMEREPEPRIRMRQEGTQTSPVYLLFNDYWGPVQVELKLLHAENVMAEPDLPARFVVPGQTEQALVGLGALDERRGFSYQLQMASVPGPPVAAVAEDLVIHPPFRSGESWPISQGFGGGKTHGGPDSVYAVDIVMPVGTDVLAVRDGVVMDVEDDFNRGGTDKERYAHKANHVRVLHDDGTMSLYAHLDLASVKVRPGARVRAGRVLARSGNTGFSSGPHLHFVIQQNTGMELVSVPFHFRQPDGATAVPEERRILRGTLPGR